MTSLFSIPTYVALVAVAIGLAVTLLRLARAVNVAACERQRAAARLEESELRFRILTRATNDAVWDWNILTNAVWWNRNVQILFGYTEEEVEPRSDWWTARVHPDDRAQVTNSVQARMRSNEDFWTSEYRFQRADGTYADICDRGYILRDQDGKAVRMIGSMMDITERKRELELARSRDAALESARLKSQFLANMSHEIRTPMNSIIGMTTILLHTELTTEQREFMEIVRTSGESLLTIINDILDFSKIEAGKLQFEMLDFELRETVDEVMMLLAERAHEKKLRLEKVIKDDVPVMVRGDPGRLRQVLTNLVSNAIKFTHEGEVMIRVERENETATHTTLRFEVADTGIGFPKEARACLFQPFSQVDASTTRKYGGTGLGLAICKQLIQLMGGQIEVQSVPGKGSTFWFTARLEKSSLDAVPVGTLALEDAPVLPDEIRHATRILVAEDNVFNQKVVTRQLREMDLTVDVVANGLEVLEAIDQIPYTLVLMDCQMPEMDGYQATAEIRRREGTTKYTPVIAMTAHVLKEDRDRCLAAGMDDFLSKPVRMANLQQTLTHWLTQVPTTSTAVMDAPSNGSNSDCTFDWEVLDEIAGHDPLHRRQLSHRFIEQTTRQLAELKQAVNNGIAPEVSRIAHYAAGSSAVCGMGRLASCFREMELLGQAGDLVGATPVFTQAEQEFETIKGYIEREL